MGKAYFVIPNAFDSTQGTNLLRFTFTTFKVGSVEQIDFTHYDPETQPSTSKTITTYDRTENNFASVTSTQPYNIWNPLYDCLKLSFDTLTYYGTCTGTQSGNSYGSWVTSLSVNKVEVTDNGGAIQYGAFGS